MAPAFAVGDPESILGETDGAEFRAELMRRLGAAPARDGLAPYYTAILPRSSWQDLLDRVEAEMGDGGSPQLWALREFKGAYLAEMTAGACPLDIPVSGRDGVLVCLGREGLKQEILRFARALGLPTGEQPVQDYFMRDVYKEDEGYDICAYCQLMLALSESERRGQPIWLI